MAEKVRLSSYWQDEEGWAGEAGKVYKPKDTVTVEDGTHVNSLRSAGLEATDQPDPKK